jgi:hypothetical protein
LPFCLHLFGCRSRRPIRPATGRYTLIIYGAPYIFGRTPPHAVGGPSAGRRWAVAMPYVGRRYTVGTPSVVRRTTVGKNPTTVGGKTAIVGGRSRKTEGLFKQLRWPFGRCAGAVYQLRWPLLQMRGCNLSRRRRLYPRPVLNVNRKDLAPIASSTD